MERTIKEWLEFRLQKIDKMSENDLLKQIKEHIIPDGKFYKSQNEWFLQVDDSLIIQVRINRRYCPINEVPAQLLLKQTGADKVLAIIISGKQVTYKNVKLSKE